MGALTLVPLSMGVDFTGTLSGAGLAVEVTVAVGAILAIVAFQAVAQERVNAARRENEAKSQFLATMSHELRTPLTSIIAYAEELAFSAEEGGRERDLHDANVIVEASQHLLGLISELMDFSKIQEGKFEIEARTFQFAKLIDKVSAVARPLAARNGNAFSIECCTKLEEIDTDEARLRQCLLNLISNASKFTHDGTIRLRISDEWRADHRGLLFEVSDTGIGIEKEQMERIFERFRQADETVTRRYGGTGLGLSIVREIAARLGGDVSVKSEVGVGSCFSLWVLTDLRRIEREVMEPQTQLKTNKERAAA